MIGRIWGGVIGALVAFSVYPATAAIITNTFGNYIAVYDDTNSYTWAEADNYAQANYGTRLATIRSSLDQTDAFNALVVDSFAWIGLNDVATEGSFEWLDGAPFDYSNFAPGEPDGSPSPADAVFMGSSFQSGEWFDTTATTTFNQFLVNLSDFTPPDPPDDPPTAVPAPGSVALLGLGLLALGRLRRVR